jgi:hypothetical protein
VKFRQKPAQIFIPGLVLDKDDGAVVPGDCFTPYDRGNPGFPGALDEVWNAVQAVAVGKRYAGDTHVPGRQAQLLRVVKPPGRGKRGVDV